MLVSGGLYMAEMGRGGRIYLLADGINCVLFDTGSPDGTLGAGQLIESAQRKPHEVRLIVLTHAHAGHAGNAEGLRLLTGAPVAASPAAAEQLAAGVRPARRFAGLLAGGEPVGPFKVDRVLQPGEVIDLCGGVEVVDAPGHASGALAFHARNAEALILGDAARVDAAGVHPPPRRRAADPATAELTAAALAARGARVLAPGHGFPTVDGRLPVRHRG